MVLHATTMSYRSYLEKRHSLSRCVLKQETYNQVWGLRHKAYELLDISALRIAPLCEIYIFWYMNKIIFMEF